MKTLIIEDEFRNYNRLRKLLLAYDPKMTIEGPLESVEETRAWLETHAVDDAPDLVMADIRLSDGISFDALDGISETSALVFTTAYDEYALQAFHYNGLAYLMKPIEEEELHRTIDRIKRWLSSHTDAAHQVDNGLKELLLQMRQDDYRYRERFLVPYKDGFEVVNVSDIAFICTIFKDTRIYLKDKKRGIFSISMSLDELERQLSPRSFFRVNRQCIIHVEAVEGLKTCFGGKLRVRIKGYDDVDVMCSREKAPSLKLWLNG